VGKAQLAKKAGTYHIRWQFNASYLSVAYHHNRMLAWFYLL
jgi:hypothetical protein